MNNFNGLGDLVDDLDQSDSHQGTTIGNSITIKGEISGEEFLTVEGNIEGKINLKNSILVKKNGFIKADIAVSSISVSGKIIGNIEATEKIELMKDSKIVGDIKAPRIVINDGAQIRGQIQMDFSIDDETKKSVETTANPFEVKKETTAFEPKKSEPFTPFKEKETPLKTVETEVDTDSGKEADEDSSLHKKVDDSGKYKSSFIVKNNNETTNEHSSFKSSF